MNEEKSLFWPKLTLWFCGIVAVIVILAMLAACLKATYQYLILPVYTVEPPRCQPNGGPHANPA